MGSDGGRSNDVPVSYWEHRHRELSGLMGKNKKSAPLALQILNTH